MVAHADLELKEVFLPLLSKWWDNIYDPLHPVFKENNFYKGILALLNGCNV